ncbi:MAG: glycosyltransferase family 39 protein, partial [Ilumatobacteraceae bacterium]
REPFRGGPGAEHGPLTSTLMAAVSWMHDPVRWQRGVTMVCGIATIAVIGLLAKAIAGRKAGLIAAGLAVVYPNMWIDDGLVMSESVSKLAVTLAMLALWYALQTHSWRRWALAGVAIGVATLARSELVVMIPLAAVLVGAAEWRSMSSPVPAVPAISDSSPQRRGLIAAGIILVAAGLTLAPWVAFNMARFQKPVLLTTNDGTTLAGSYCERTFHGEDLGGWNILCLGDDITDQQAMEPSIRSAHRRSVALSYLRDHVSEIPKVVVARVARGLDLFRLHNMVRQDVGEERIRWASWAGIFSFWVLAPLAGLGLTRIRRRDRWLLLLPVIVVAATTVAFYGAHRIRSSAEPTVVIGAAVMLAALAERLNRRRMVSRTTSPDRRGRP